MDKTINSIHSTNIIYFLNVSISKLIGVILALVNENFIWEDNLERTLKTNLLNFSLYFNIFYSIIISSTVEYPKFVDKIKRSDFSLSLLANKSILILFLTIN